MSPNKLQSVVQTVLDQRKADEYKALYDARNQSIEDDNHKKMLMGKESFEQLKATEKGCSSTSRSA